MSKFSNGPLSLAEAIERLENTDEGNVHNFKRPEKEHDEVRKTLDELKPYLDHLRENVGNELKMRKNQVEQKVKESPWMALGVVGLLALIVGLLFGSRRRD